MRFGMRMARRDGDNDDPNSNKCMCAWDCSVFIRGAPVRFLSQPPRPWACRLCRRCVDVHAFGGHEARGTPHAPPTTHHAPWVPCHVDIHHWMPRLAFPLRRRESISMLRSSPTRKLLWPSRSRVKSTSTGQQGTLGSNRAQHFPGIAISGEGCLVCAFTRTHHTRTHGTQQQPMCVV